jgi:hypothetical protein
MQPGTHLFYANVAPYALIGQIFMEEHISSLFNFGREAGGESPMMVINKVLSSEKTNTSWLVIDTIYNGENCWKLEFFECMEFFFTKEDSLNLVNRIFLSWDDKERIQEIVNFWDGGRACKREITIVNKRDHAVMVSERLTEAVDNRGREFSRYSFAEFEKQGRRYVPKYFFFNSHNTLRGSPFFSQTGNRTLIVRTPSSNPKPLTEAKFFPRHFDLYLHFADLLEEPSQKIVDFWEKYRDIAK